MDLGERKGPLRAEQSHSAGGQVELRRIQGPGDHCLSASQPKLEPAVGSDYPLQRWAVARSSRLFVALSISRLSARARSQTGIAAGGDKKRNRNSPPPLP